MGKGNALTCDVLLIDDHLVRGLNVARCLKGHMPGLRVDVATSLTDLTSVDASLDSERYEAIVALEGPGSRTVRGRRVPWPRLEDRVVAAWQADETGTSGPVLQRLSCGTVESPELLAHWIVARISKQRDTRTEEMTESHLLEDEMVTGSDADTTARPQPRTQPLGLEGLQEVVLRAMGEGVVVTDDADRIVFANDQFASLIGLDEERLLGLDVYELLADPLAVQAWERAVGLTQQGKTARVELNLQSSQAAVPVQLTRTPLGGTGQDQWVHAAVNLFSNLSTVKEREAVILDQNKRLHRRIITDELTGLMNRRRFNEILGRMWQRWQRKGEPMACLMIGVDQLRRVNDRFGHSRGDVVLRRLADVLRSNAISEGAVARYGGSEFAAMLPNTSGEGAYLWAEQFRRSVEDLCIIVGSEELRVTTSIGVAATSEKLSGPGELVCRADLALYEAKRKGRNRVSLWRLPSAAELIEAAREEVSSQAAEVPPVRTTQGHDPAWVSRAAMAMARAIGEKDHATGAHCMWVGWVAAEIGRQLGLSEHQVDQLHTAGVLHDLGKISVPSAILLKPGPLTEQERDLVDCHADIGADLVSHQQADIKIQQAIRYHHDWYDGSRGTSGKRGQSLPHYARILSVADSFQSMIEERPYRPALSIEEALCELRRCCGSQFDPDVVEVLAQVVTDQDRLLPSIGLSVCAR